MYQKYYGVSCGAFNKTQKRHKLFEAVYGHSLIINPSLGMYQEIHPSGVFSIGSVKINTSLQCSGNVLNFHGFESQEKTLPDQGLEWPLPEEEPHVVHCTCNPGNLNGQNQLNICRFDYFLLLYLFLIKDFESTIP